MKLSRNVIIAIIVVIIIIIAILYFWVWRTPKNLISGKLKKVTGVKAEIKDDTHARVKWDKVKNAQTYKVDISIGVKTKSEVTDRTDIKIPVFLGPENTITVTAINKNGEGKPSDPYILKSLIPAPITGDRSPSTLYKQISENLFSVTWDVVPGAIGYSVYILRDIFSTQLYVNQPTSHNKFNIYIENFNKDTDQAFIWIHTKQGITEPTYLIEP